MSKEQRRGRALRSILGVPEDQPIGEYPEAITLPPRILAKSSRAIRGTRGDLCERSIGFHHINERWYGEVALIGAEVELKKVDPETQALTVQAQPNPFALVMTRIFRPHIWLHTHPDRLPPRLSRYLEEGENPASPSLVMTPSIGDVRSFMRGTGGTVGSMVGSKYGHFLLVRQEASRPSRLAKNDPKIIAVAQTLLDAEAAIEGLDAEQVGKVRIDAIAEATQQDFVCYVSHDPESPRLERVR